MHQLQSVEYLHSVNAVLCFLFVYQIENVSIVQRHKHDSVYLWCRHCELWDRWAVGFIYCVTHCAEIHAGVSEFNLILSHTIRGFLLIVDRGKSIMAFPCEVTEQRCRSLTRILDIPNKIRSDRNLIWTIQEQRIFFMNDLRGWCLIYRLPMNSSCRNNSNISNK